MRLEFRGLFQAAYIRFLLELGGKEVPTGISSDRGVIVVEGDNWRAELEPEETIPFSKSLLIPRSFITFSGEEETVEDIVGNFRKKTLRGGG